MVVADFRMRVQSYGFLPRKPKKEQTFLYDIAFLRAKFIFPSGHYLLGMLALLFFGGLVAEE